MTARELQQSGAAREPCRIHRYARDLRANVSMIELSAPPNSASTARSRVPRLVAGLRVGDAKVGELKVLLIHLEIRVVLEAAIHLDRSRRRRVQLAPRTRFEIRDSPRSRVEPQMKPITRDPSAPRTLTRIQHRRASAFVANSRDSAPLNVLQYSRRAILTRLASLSSRLAIARILSQRPNANRNNDKLALTSGVTGSGKVAIYHAARSPSARKRRISIRHSVKAKNPLASSASFVRGRLQRIELP